MRLLFFCEQSYTFGILRPLEEAALAAGHQVLWYVIKELRNKFPFADAQVTSELKEAKAFQSDAVLAPGNTAPYFLRGVKVQVFHGFAGEKKGHFRIRDYFDLYLTQGPYFTERFIELARQHKDIQIAETGWCKLDPLYTGAQDAPELRNKYQLGEEDKIILYAPTFSPKLTSAPAMLPELKDLAQSGQANVKVLIKFHPLMDKQLMAEYQQAFANSRMVQVADEDDLIPFLKLSQVMISDTSSAVYEFALLNKPVITLNTSTPNPLWQDLHNAQEVLPAALAAANSSSVEQSEIFRLYHPYADGQSSARMLTAIENYISQFGAPQMRNLKLWRKLTSLKRFYLDQKG